MILYLYFIYLSLSPKEFVHPCSCVHCNCQGKGIQIGKGIFPNFFFSGEAEWGGCWYAHSLFLFFWQGLTSKTSYIHYHFVYLYTTKSCKLNFFTQWNHFKQNFAGKEVERLTAEFNKLEVEDTNLKEDLKNTHNR